MKECFENRFPKEVNIVDIIFRGGCEMTKLAWTERELQRARGEGDVVVVCASRLFELLSCDGDGVVLPPTHSGYERRERVIPSPLTASSNAVFFVDALFSRARNETREAYWYIAPRQVLLDVYELCVYDMALFVREHGLRPSSREECVILRECIEVLIHLSSLSGGLRSVGSEMIKSLSLRYPKKRFPNIARTIVGNSSITSGCVLAIAAGALEDLVVPQSSCGEEASETASVIFILSDLLGESASAQAVALLGKKERLSFFILTDAEDYELSEIKAEKRIFTERLPAKIAPDLEVWGASPDAAALEHWGSTLEKIGFKSAQNLPVETPAMLEPLDCIVYDVARAKFSIDPVYPEWSLKEPPKLRNSVDSPLDVALRELDEPEKEPEYIGALNILRFLEDKERSKYRVQQIGAAHQAAIEEDDERDARRRRDERDAKMRREKYYGGVKPKSLRDIQGGEHVESTGVSASGGSQSDGDSDGDSDSDDDMPF